MSRMPKDMQQIIQQAQQMQKQMMPDDPEMAGDLVVAAVNQAMAAMSADAESTMGGLAGGMDLGGMLG